MGVTETKHGDIAEVKNEAELYRTALGRVYMPDNEKSTPNTVISEFRGSTEP